VTREPAPLERDDDRYFRDTGALSILTGRSHWVIRANCHREPDGYDVMASAARLEGVPDPVLITAADAERYLGIRAATVRQWAHRQLISSYDRDRHGSPLYDVSELLQRRRS
jgi:hypothetical protein